jgi:hypothetical protein
MSHGGPDTFLPAVPMGMSGLAEVMAILAGFPEKATSGPAGRFTTRASGPTEHIRALPTARRER